MVGSAEKWNGLDAVACLHGAADQCIFAKGEMGPDLVVVVGIRDRPTAARSPWQNGHCERLIGSIRRECLDHVIIFGERHLWQVLRSYAHLSLSQIKSARGVRGFIAELDWTCVWNRAFMFATRRGVHLPQ